MSDNKILQTILDRVIGVDEKVINLEKKVDNLDKNLTSRIDKLGLQIASLADDAPTIAEFDNLEKRVSKLENHFIPA